MRGVRVSEEDLIEKISAVFRLHGYEGASIRLLSAATGLERASLYHRFPGGKEEMAAAVIRHIEAWFTANVFEPLADKSKTPAERVEVVARNLGKFYRRGKVWCVLDCMTIGGSDTIRDAIRDVAKAWNMAFRRVARESGASDVTAYSRAMQAVIEIEGALVLSRATGDPRPFQLVLYYLPAKLTRN